MHPHHRIQWTRAAILIAKSERPAPPLQISFMSKILRSYPRPPLDHSDIRLEVFACQDHNTRRLMLRLSNRIGIARNISP